MLLWSTRESVLTNAASVHLAQSVGTAWRPMSPCTQVLGGIAVNSVTKLSAPHPDYDCTINAYMTNRQHTSVHFVTTELITSMTSTATAWVATLVILAIIAANATHVSAPKLPWGSTPTEHIQMRTACLAPSVVSPAAAKLLSKRICSMNIQKSRQKILKMVQKNKARYPSPINAWFVPSAPIKDSCWSSTC